MIIQGSIGSLNGCPIVADEIADLDSGIVFNPDNAAEVEILNRIFVPDGVYLCEAYS